MGTQHWPHVGEGKTKKPRPITTQTCPFKQVRLFLGLVPLLEGPAHTENQDSPSALSLYPLSAQGCQPLWPLGYKRNTQNGLLAEWKKPKTDLVCRHTLCN